MNNSLVKEYFRAVREIKPKAFVMENVSMLASETHRFYDSRIDHEEIIKLVISYFYRNSRMYDTLMQMGRWFGCRGKYADFCRIWMSDDSIEWYRYIC